MYAPWFCLLTTKIWSNRHLSPRCITALGSWTNRVIALRPISGTALFYLEDSRRIHPWSVRACQPKFAKRMEERASRHGRQRGRGRARARALWLLFLCFSSPWACPMQIGLAGSAVCYTWSLHSSPQTFLWPPLFYFCGLFPSYSFSHRHFGLLFPILTT